MVNFPFSGSLVVVVAKGWIAASLKHRNKITRRGLAQCSYSFIIVIPFLSLSLFVHVAGLINTNVCNIPVNDTEI